MFDFLLTATDRHGKRSKHHVIAASAAEAVAKLEAEGHSEIILHTDDVAAASVVVPELRSGKVTPEDLVELMGATSIGLFIYFLKKQLLNLRATVAYAIVLSVIGANLFLGGPYGITFWVLVAYTASPFLIAMYLAFFTESRHYKQLLEASSWGRWTTVLDLAERLRGKVPDLDLGIRAAIALAQLGKREEAEAKVTSLASDETVPRWMYLMRAAEFYESIEEFDIALEHHENAYQEAPDNPTVELDYARFLFERERNLPPATELIASAQTKKLSDLLLQMLVPYVKGLQQLCHQRYPEAQLLFLESRKQLNRLAEGEPLCRLIQDICSAYIVIASSKIYDVDTAKHHAPAAIKRLEALGDDRLLARVNEALSTMP